MFSSRLTAYFRRKGMAVTDRRVQKMNEILSYIKFIKMYAWVKAFSQDVRRTYSDETLAANVLTQMHIAHDDTCVFCFQVSVRRSAASLNSPVTFRASPSAWLPLSSSLPA